MKISNAMFSFIFYNHLGVHKIYISQKSQKLLQKFNLWTKEKKRYTRSATYHEKIKETFLKIIGNEIPEGNRKPILPARHSSRKVQCKDKRERCMKCKSSKEMNETDVRCQTTRLQLATKVMLCAVGWMKT